MTAHFPEKPTPDDLKLSAYHFELPEELIAQEPPAARGASRLLVHDRATGRNTASMFEHLADYLPPGLIVANNSRVVPARVMGKRESGGKVEFLLTTPLPHIQEIAESESPDAWRHAEVACLLKSSKKVKIGETIDLGEHFTATVTAREDYGRCAATMRWRGNLPKMLITNGVMPLPPYIKRPQNEEDAERYQTIYASPDKAGSIAAPTAGLHFTPTLRQSLIDKGFSWEEVTLYVGYGTFSPVRCDDIRDHAMHREYCEISETTATAVNAAKAAGKPVIAVGTTAARTLEGVMLQRGRIEAFAGWTDIFLYPGKPVQVVNHLITNFHLPESTLLMLVSALAGREAMLHAYATAVAERFRFFSYGDAMLVL